MDVSSCSNASNNNSSHGYNLRKRSVSSYFPVSAKRLKPTQAETSATAMTTPRTTTTRKTRKKDAKLKWKKFPNLVKEEVFEFDDYLRRTRTPNATSVKNDFHIHELSVCVMERIFKLLEPLERIKVERVCRRWNFIARNFAWNSCTTLCAQSVASDEANHLPTDGGWFLYGRRVHNRITAVVNRSGKYLENINFSHLTFLDYKICNVLRHTPRLVHLDLTAILLTNSSLSTIGGHLPQLKSAVFRRCFHRTQVERGMSRFLSECRCLETLDVSDNEYFVGSQCFNELPPTLLHLRISHSFRIADAALAGVQRNCPHLRSLVMDRLDMISPGALNRLFENLPELETLQYGDCFNNNFTSTEILSVGHLKNLKQLTLYDNIIVTEELLKAISFNCHNLERLDLSSSNRHVSDQGLRFLANLTHLTVLNLGGMRLLSDHTLCEIAANGQLKELLLHRCCEITDESIIYVLKRCKKLRMLDVSHCTLVTDASVKQLVENLNALHGKTLPSTNTSDTEKFCFWGKRSGITSPMPKHLTHPWMKLMNEMDYEYMLMGHLIHWTTFSHFHQLPWLPDI